MLDGFTEGDWDSEGVSHLRVALLAMDRDLWNSNE